MMLWILLGLLAAGGIVLAINEFLLDESLFASDAGAQAVYLVALLAAIVVFAAQRYRGQWRAVPVHLAIWLAIVVVLALGYRVLAP